MTRLLDGKSFLVTGAARGLGALFCQEIARAGGSVLALGRKKEALTKMLADSDMIAMARELMWNSDWPAHAAYVLGLDDPYSYLPDGYAHRLRQREEQKKMKINQDKALIEKSLRYFMDDEEPSSQ